MLRLFPGGRVMAARPKSRVVVVPQATALDALGALIGSLSADRRALVRATIAAGAVDIFGADRRMEIARVLDRAFAAINAARWHQLEGLDGGGR